MSIRLERPTRHQMAPMVAALASWASPRAEASGVTVCTPAAKSAAVRTYLSSGLSVVEKLHAPVSPQQ